MLHRRQFLLAGAAALTAPAARAFDVNDVPFSEIYGRIEDYPRFLTLAELQQRVNSLQRRYPSLLTRRVIGRSKRGAPIELVSLGGGRRSALVVAGLHPNEQVGALTSEFLMAELCRNQKLREQLNFTWHFINPVDPDGMSLNEGWLRAPLTLESYLRSLFRPALARQAEYTFPLQVGPLTFNDAPPENHAWREALQLTKPALQYTQHNADYGGAFFLTSVPDPVLETQLQALPARYDVTLSRVGEPMAEIAARSEGVFALPMPMESLMKVSQRAGAEELRNHWSAGDSSTSYASRYGTFSISAEVPMWDDARVRDQGRSEISVGYALREFTEWGRSAMELIGRWEPKLGAVVRESELMHALNEYSQAASGRLVQIEQMLGSGKVDGVFLTVADAAAYRTTLRLSVLRPVAYLTQLAQLQSDSAAASAAEQGQTFIARHLVAMRAEADLRTIPLRSLVAIQVAAGLVGAEAVNRRSIATP